MNCVVVVDGHKGVSLGRYGSKVKCKVRMDSAQEGEWWVTASSIRNGVMNGTEECKCA